MRISRQLHNLLVMFLCLGLILSGSIVVAGDIPPGSSVVKTIVQDVALGDRGTLTGHVVDHTGNLREGHVFVLQGPRTAPVQFVSDGAGRFVVTGLDGGEYTLAEGAQVVHLRCWAPGTAPPQATHELALVSGSVVRGQVSPGCWGLTNPWVVAGIVAAAIAIPIALSENRDDRDDASQ